MTEQKYKYDIFKILERLSVKDIGFFENISEEDKKALHPLVLAGWMFGTTDERQIVFLNEIVNPFIFNLGKHKQLLLKLLTITSSGKSKRYNWIKSKNNKSTSVPKCINVIKQYYGYSTLQAKDVLSLLTDTDILEYASYLGYQPDELKLITKELKFRHLVE
jgi:hypothetical protein